MQNLSFPSKRLIFDFRIYTHKAMESILTPPQQDKFERAKRYLALSAPNEWRTLAELDHILSAGAQMVRFPWEWVRAVKEAARESPFGLQMRLPSVASGQGKESIALCFASLKFSNAADLISSLNSPDCAAQRLASAAQRQQRPSGAGAGGDTAAATTDGPQRQCVGTNTQYLAQGDALTEHTVRLAAANGSVLYVANSSGGLAKRFQRRTDGGGGANDDDEDGGGGGTKGLDGGRSRLAQWLTEAPMAVIRSSVKTRRGIIETSYGGAAVPMSLREGEEMIMRVQRQDDPNRQRYGAAAMAGSSSSSSSTAATTSAAPPFSHPRGTTVVLSLTVNNAIPSPESGSGLVISPSDLAFGGDGQFADIKFTARRKGSYIVGFTVTVQPPPSSSASSSASDLRPRETVYECAIRMGVGEVYSYAHSQNSASIVKADECDMPGAAAPGGVVLFRNDVFPVALPKEFCLSTFAEASLQPSQQTAQHEQKVRAALQQQQKEVGAAAGAAAGGAQIPRPLSWWWCDVAPAPRALAEANRPSAADLKACASNVMSGPFLFTSVLDASSGAGAQNGEKEWDAAYRDADGNVDLAKVRRTLQEEARQRADHAKAIAARRLKRKHRNRELTNTHLLNFGIDLRKPFRK